MYSFNICTSIMLKSLIRKSSCSDRGLQLYRKRCLLKFLIWKACDACSWFGLANVLARLFCVSHLTVSGAVVQGLPAQQKLASNSQHTLTCFCLSLLSFPEKFASLEIPSLENILCFYLYACLEENGMKLHHLSLSGYALGALSL